MKTKILPLLLLSALLLGSCGEKYDVPTSFDIKLETISATRASISVKPASNDAWYAYILVSDGSLEALVKEEFLFQAVIENCEGLYEYIISNSSEYASFSDLFFFNGPRTHRLENLVPGIHHKIYFYQVNPKTHEKIGEYNKLEFDTPSIQESDLSFEVTSSGTTVKIIPSNGNENYLWDFDETSFIESDYSNSPQLYLYSLAGMYYEYGFFSSKVSRGEEAFDMSKSGRDLKEGGHYTLSIAGIDSAGEFTTMVYSYTIIYSSGGLEIIDENFIFP